MLTSWLSLAVIGTICTERSSPTSSGPITVAPPKLLQHLGRDRRGVERRHDQHVGRPRQAAEWIGRGGLRIERDIGRHLAVVFEIDAALIENLHRLDARARSARPADGRTWRTRAARAAARSRAGAPRPRPRSRCRRGPAAFGISVMAVSATSTLRPRASTSETPITRWPGFGSITRRTSSSATEKLRVTPVTMASASSSATMQAAKWLRSVLTSRCTSRSR